MNTKDLFPKEEQEKALLAEKVNSTAVSTLAQREREAVMEWIHQLLNTQSLQNETWYFRATANTSRDQSSHNDVIKKLSYDLDKKERALNREKEHLVAMTRGLNTLSVKYGLSLIFPEIDNNNTGYVCSCLFAYAEAEEKKQKLKGSGSI